MHGVSVGFGSKFSTEMARGRLLLPVFPQKNTFVAKPNEPLVDGCGIVEMDSYADGAHMYSEAQSGRDGDHLNFEDDSLIAKSIIYRYTRSVDLPLLSV